MNTADKIRKIRTDNGLTRQEFADRIGITVSNVEAIERGEVIPDEKFIASICLQFGLSKYDFDNLGEITGAVSCSPVTVTYASVPVKTNKKSIFVRNGLKMYILPRILFFIIAFVISMPLIFIRMADGNFSMSEFFVMGDATYHFSFLISLPFAYFCYKSAFSYLKKKEFAKKSVYAFIVFESGIVGLITSAFTCVRDILTNTVGIKIKYVNMPVLILTAAFCSMSVITALFFFERMSQEEKNAQINRKFVTGSTAVILCGVVCAVLNFFVVGVHSPYPAVMQAVRIIAIAYGFYLNSDTKKLSSAVFSKVLPVVILLTLILTSFASANEY